MVLIGAFDFAENEFIYADNFSVFISLQDVPPLHNLDDVVPEDAKDQGHDDIGGLGSNAGGGATDISDDESERLPETVVTEGGFTLTGEYYTVQCSGNN